MDTPVNENYLSQFRDCFPLHVADFLRVWYHYDKDRSGYLEIAEFKNFLQDLITNAGSKITTKEVEEYAKNLIDMYDADCDARIGLNELSKIITVEENFLKRFKKLNLEDFDAIFKHYDQDGTGSLEDAELLGFIKDLMEKIDGIKDPNIDEVEAYKITVLRSIGENDSGKVSKEDLKLLFI